MFEVAAVAVFANLGLFAFAALFVVPVAVGGNAGYTVVAVGVIVVVAVAVAALDDGRGQRVATAVAAGRTP